MNWPHGWHGRGVRNRYKGWNWNASMIPIGLVFEGLNEGGRALFRMNMDTIT